MVTNQLEFDWLGERRLKIPDVRSSGSFHFALPNGMNGDLWFGQEDAGPFSSPYGAYTVVGSGMISVAPQTNETIEALPVSGVMMTGGGLFL